MTTRELRQLLTSIEEQEMTIRELRKILFDVDEQDTEINETKLKVIEEQSKRVKA